jgi:translation initiation factor 5
MDNINWTVDDDYYRYKMPKLQIKIEGNGIKTILVNVKDLAKSLDRPHEYLVKFFAQELSCQSIIDEKNAKYILSGSRTLSELDALVKKFITKYDLCIKCSLPETTLLMHKAKLSLSCKACGSVNAVSDLNHKLSVFIEKKISNKK